MTESVPEDSGNPRIILSVIVAAWPDLDGLGECLESLATQVDPTRELIVVGLQASPAEIQTRFPWVYWLQGSPNMLVPHLWNIGIKRSRGTILALTTSRFVPAPDWLDRICEAHRRLSSAGIGGAIDHPHGRNAKDWAIYFLRYSAYLNYRREQIVSEIAGENASYKRVALVAHDRAMADGFWEPEFHRLLRGEGKTLTFVPAIRVRQGVGFGARSFCAQRLRHGRHFSRTRLQGSSLSTRIARVITSPLIPAVLLTRIFRRVLASRRFTGELLFSLPFLFGFILCWSVGETLGYCTACLDRAATGRRQKALE